MTTIPTEAAPATPAAPEAGPANDNSAAAVLAAADPAAPADLPSWAAELGPEDQEWLGKAGHRELPKLVKSHRELERFLGADKAGRGLVLPAESPAENPEAWSAVYERLGRPAEPAAYGLDRLEGADPAFAADAAAAFHAAGLNPAQAESLAEWWSTKAAGAKAGAEEARAEADAAFEAKGEAEIQELRKAWGESYEARAEAGRRAARQFGFSAEELTKMERALGTRGLIERMAAIGAALAEDAGPPAEAQATGPGNAASAKAQIESLKRDPAFIAAYLDPRSPDHAEAKARMTRLQQQAAGQAGG